MINKTEVEYGLKMIPFLGTLLVLSGIIHASTFYSNFGISINGFLTFGESLVLFLDDILLNLFVLIAIVIIEILGEESILRKEAQEDIVNETKKRRIDWVILIVVILFVITLSLFIMDNYWKKILSLDVRLYNSLLLKLSALVTFADLLNNKINSEKVGLYINYLFISMLYFVFIIYRGQERANSVLKLSKNDKVSGQMLLKDSSVINIDSSKVYLGKTNSTYFYYDIKLNTSYILDASQVTKTSVFNIKK